MPKIVVRAVIGILRAEPGREVCSELVERLGRGLCGGVDQVRYALLDVVILAFHAPIVVRPEHGIS